MVLSGTNGRLSQAEFPAVSTFPPSSCFGSAADPRPPQPPCWHSAIRSVTSTIFRRKHSETLGKPDSKRARAVALASARGHINKSQYGEATPPRPRDFLRTEHPRGNGP